MSFELSLLVDVVDLGDLVDGVVEGGEVVELPEVGRGVRYQTLNESCIRRWLPVLNSLLYF